MSRGSGGLHWGIRGVCLSQEFARLAPKLAPALLRPQGPRGTRRAGGGEGAGTKAALPRRGGRVRRQVPPRCRDLASPGPGRAPASLRTSASMDRPGAQPGPAQAEPARPPPALPPPPPPPPLPAAAPRAANMAAAAVGRDTLPEHWSYGVCRDGRVFFIKCGAGTPGRGPGRGRAGVRAGRASPEQRRR